MLPPDGRRYRCRWIEDSLTIHSDGNVTCGLDDPFAERSFGNIKLQPVEAINRNPEYGRIISALAQGRRCRDCTLFEPLADDYPEPERLAEPTTLVVEPTITCNLRCPQKACIPNNDAATKTRAAANLDLGTFESLVAQVSGSVKYVYFFNYGDPFMHRAAESMLAEIARTIPHARITTSTNAIPLKNRARAAAVVAAGVDHVTCTISGMHQESYERYHANGRLDHALQGMFNLAEEKRVQRTEKPEIVWRYLLFRWTDDEEQVQAAMDLARQHGVSLRLYLTTEPPEAASYRFSPGSPLHERYRALIDGAHGYASPPPDRDGFYHGEEFEGFGPGRWTCHKARLAFEPRHRWVRFSLATNRTPAGRASTAVRIVTPWGAYDVALEAGRWQEIVLRIPAGHRGRGGYVFLHTDDYWFPAEDLGSTDLRCLGVIVRQPEDALGLSQWLRAYRHNARLSRTRREVTAEEMASWSIVPLPSSRQARYVAFEEG